jgi:hypothetical protein
MTNLDAETNPDNWQVMTKNPDKWWWLQTLITDKITTNPDKRQVMTTNPDNRQVMTTNPDNRLQQ